eukprot:scaffold2027_cov148-Skeletonema_marinoi.AAC.3
MAPNDIRERDDDDDVAALIYRESQLRKAEAAAAAESKKSSSASTHHRTSTRKRPPVNSHGKESLPRQQREDVSKRTRGFSADDDRPSKKLAKKKHRYECSAEGCTNKVVRGGLCVRHGAKVKRCISEGCTNQVIKRGVCMRHGATLKIKRCSNEGCTNQAPCACGMGQKSNAVSVKDAQIKSSKEECA